MGLRTAFLIAFLLGCAAARPAGERNLPLPSARYPLRLGMPTGEVQAALPGGTTRRVGVDAYYVTGPPVRRGRLLLTTTGVVRRGRLSGVQVLASLRKDGAISTKDFAWHQESLRRRCAALYGWRPRREGRGWRWTTEALEARLDLLPPAAYMEQVAVLGTLTLERPPKKKRVKKKRR